MRRYCLICRCSFAIGLGLLSWAPAVLGGIVFDSNEADFRARSSTLSTQTFAGANVPTGLAVESSSLTGATNDQVFHAGSILPGLSFTTSNAGLGRDLELTGASGPSGTGANAGGYANNVLHPAFYYSPLQVGFGTGEGSVGLGLLSSYASAAAVLEDSVSVYSTTGALLGSMVVAAPASGAGQFLGILATGGDLIGSVSIASTTVSIPEGIFSEPGLDRVLFAPPAAVPEPASAAMLGAGLLGLVAIGRLRASKRRVSLAPVVR